MEELAPKSRMLTQSSHVCRGRVSTRSSPAFCLVCLCRDPMARRSKLRPRGNRPALAPRLIAIKQRFLRRYRARLHRVKHEDRPFARALRTLCFLAALCAIFTLSYAFTRLLLELLSRTRLEGDVFAVWSSVMHLGCLMYSIWVGKL